MKNALCTIFVVCLLAFSSLALSSCGRMIHRGKEMVFGVEHTKGEVSTQVRRFHEALYWGKVEIATAFVSPDKRDSFGRVAKERKEQERLVEIDVQKVELDEGSETATVDVSIKYYTIPEYVVETRTEKQFWQFNADAGGWMFRDASAIETL